MTTTIEIPDDIMKRVMLATLSQSPQEAVIKVMEEFAREHDQRRLIPLLGTSDGFMTLEELNEMREME